jgi:hypothetical protein
MSLFLFLPDDVLLDVFLCMDYRDILAMRQVSPTVSFLSCRATNRLSGLHAHESHHTYSCYLDSRLGSSFFGQFAYT